jgi:hypothetical protein
MRSRVYSKKRRKKLKTGAMKEASAEGAIVKASGYAVITQRSGHETANEVYEWKAR